MEGLNWLVPPQGRASAIVCLHGFLGVPGDWSPFAAECALLRPDIAVAAPVLPLTHSGGIASPHLLAESIERGLDSEGLASATLAGYSMGGRAGLEMALFKPERFPHFVGISTTAGLDCEVERSARRGTDARLAERLRNRDWREFLDFWWKQPVFHSPNREPNPPADYLAERLRLNPDLMADWLVAWSPGALDSQWDKLSHYPGRALWVAGAEDRKYTQEANRLNRMSKDSRAILIGGCGHQILREAARSLAVAVAKFLPDANSEAMSPSTSSWPPQN